MHIYILSEVSLEVRGAAIYFQDGAQVLFNQYFIFGRLFDIFILLQI